MTPTTPTSLPIEGESARPEPRPEPRIGESIAAAVHPADLALARAVQRGERDSTARFFERLDCVPRILAALNRRRGAALSADEVADLAQDTLTLLWKKLPGYAARSSLETWAYRFCALELANAVRRKRRHSRLAGTAPAGSAVPAEPEPFDSEIVHSGLDRLSDSEAAVVRLKHFELLTFDEIGARLAISPNTAKTIYYRGLDRLRAWLQPHFREDDR